MEQSKRREESNTMTLEPTPIAKAEMLIRKPGAEVFEAFVNPEIATKF
jgi:uncharacterized protein YndB with AHSA1/START domain